MTDTALTVHRLADAVADTGTGASAAPPVVLLHGFTASAAADFPAAAWAAALPGRTLLAPDLPGHGDSPAVASEREGRTASVVAAILAAVREVGSPQVDVIGYSLGARLAWELPSAAPGLIRRLVLGGISPVEPFAAVDRAALRSAAGLQGGTADAADADATATDATAEPGTDAAAGGPDPLTAMMAGMISAPGLDTASLANLIGGLAAEPFEPAAAPPAVPTLLVAGSDDVMSQGIERLAALLPDARLARVPGDHAGALASDEFRAAAREFLG